MENKKVRIKYLLSEKGRKASLLAGGDGKEKQTVYAPLTPELVELGTVHSDGSVVLQVPTGDIELRPTRHAPGWEWRYQRAAHHFDAPQTAESLIEWEKDRRARIEAAKADPENLARIAELEAKFIKAEADKAAAKAASEAAKAERERREQEKADWIGEHGSDHLRRAYALGYDCQRKYVTERAEKEFPEFAVDFDDNAEWKSRACPSKDALDLVEKLIEQGHNAECVWLTHPWYQLAAGDYYEEPEEFDPCEAVVVRQYLGKYTLVLVL